MLSLALTLFSLAVLIGIVIGIRFLNEKRPPSRVIAAAHGLLGAVGLAALIVALKSGAGAGDQYGTASFGPAAAVLAAVALLAGVGIALLARRMTRNIGVLIGVHASVAVTAYVLLLAFAFLA